MKTFFSSFGELTKAYDKARPLIIKDEGEATPRFYARILVEMEDIINETWSERKSLNKNQSQFLSKLKQKLGKYKRENERIDKDMEKFREDPDAEDEPEEAEGAGGGDGSDSDSGDDGPQRKSASKSREGSEQPEKEKFKKALGKGLH